MNCPLCNKEMHTQYANNFHCFTLHKYYIRDGNSYAITKSKKGPWHQIIMPPFAIDFFEGDQEILVYKLGGGLFLREENKSLQDFLNLYHRLDNLKAFL